MNRSITIHPVIILFCIYVYALMFIFCPLLDFCCCTLIFWILYVSLCMDSLVMFHWWTSCLISADFVNDFISSLTWIEKNQISFLFIHKDLDMEDTNRKCENPWGQSWRTRETTINDHSLHWKIHQIRTLCYLFIGSFGLIQLRHEVDLSSESGSFNNITKSSRPIVVDGKTCTNRSLQISFAFSICNSW